MSTLGVCFAQPPAAEKAEGGRDNGKANRLPDWRSIFSDARHPDLSSLSNPRLSHTRLGREFERTARYKSRLRAGEQWLLLN